MFIDLTLQLGYIERALIVMGVAAVAYLVHYRL